MKLKKTLAAGLTTVVLAGSCLSVSAAPATGTVNNLTAEEISLILDVEAYKQAYPDLAVAFGDDINAYVNHYLTYGVYEGRTKGVLFDPLTYAEAYGDIRSAFGYDVTALVKHYVNYGVAENRTMGTSHGFADIATAESSGMEQSYIPRALASEYKNLSNQNSSATSSQAAGSNTVSSSAAANSNTGSSVAASSNTGSTVTAPTGNNSSSAATAGGSTDTSSAASSGNNLASIWEYHHTTSIYHDDGKTLWRVEYYDENNQLIRYSDVTNVDPDTNSYTETIYYTTGDNVVDRTDTYVNGVLQSSVAGSN